MISRPDKPKDIFITFETSRKVTQKHQLIAHILRLAVIIWNFSRERR
jgi:hypothetical protein